MLKFNSISSRNSALNSADNTFRANTSDNEDMNKSGNITRKWADTMRMSLLSSKSKKKSQLTFNMAAQQ